MNNLQQRMELIDRHLYQLGKMADDLLQGHDFKADAHRLKAMKSLIADTTKEVQRLKQMPPFSQA